MPPRLIPALLLAIFAGAAVAKLPAPVLDDAAKAKAAEAAARTGWQAKVEAFQLCKAQDRVVARYKSGQKGDAKAAAPAAKPAAGASGGAVVAAGTAAPCADPGPFAYNPPEQKPLEASGAHSPTGTSGGTPSVRTPSAQMQPSKPGVAPSATPAAPPKKS